MLFKLTIWLMKTENKFYMKKNYRYCTLAVDTHFLY